MECVHMLHLVPSWQSGEKHRRLKTIMQDRPDLIQSELSGLAFEALQQAFRAVDVDNAFELQAPTIVMYQVRTYWDFFVAKLDKIDIPNNQIHIFYILLLTYSHLLYTALTTARLYICGPCGGWTFK